MTIYKETLLMLDACNLSGLAKSFAEEIMPAIWQEVRTKNGGTNNTNEHPVAVLWTQKMASLATGECLCEDCIEAFGKAYREVQQRARQGETC